MFLVKKLSNWILAAGKIQSGKEHGGVSDRTQEMMKWWSGILSSSMEDGNTGDSDNYTEENGELTWMYVFVESISYFTVSVPWSSGHCSQNTWARDVCLMIRHFEIRLIIVTIIQVSKSGSSVYVSVVFFLVIVFINFKRVLIEKRINCYLQHPREDWWGSSEFIKLDMKRPQCDVNDEGNKRIGK